MPWCGSRFDSWGIKVLGDVRPYLVPDPSSVQFGPWRWTAADRTEELPGCLPDWDTNTDLHIVRDVSVDFDQLLQQTSLPPATVFALAVSWTSSTTGMNGSIEPYPIAGGGVVSLAATLPGDRLAGVMTLRTTLTLFNSPPVRAPGVVWLPGSVLIEDNHHLGLEGNDPPFPTHEIDFAHTRLDPDASWHLETSTELTAPFLGTFQLLLNRRDTELIAAVSRGRKDGRQQVIVDDLEHGVATLLLELALHHRHELAEHDDWPPGTVGDVLDRILCASSASGHLRVSTGPHDVAEARTMLAGAARAAGRGRRFG
jgi:hypothetical protein